MNYRLFIGSSAEHLDYAESIQLNLSHIKNLDVVCWSQNVIRVSLYILGQDSSNRVKAAKIVLNTLYDYANDGAWLPVIASDGVPAYIKAYQPEEAET